MVKLDEEITKTVLGMKRVISKKRDSPAAQDSYLQPSNRGNKLKRKAHQIEDGTYSRRKGSRFHNISIEHAGYYRNILQRNPKRYDHDGYELSDSEEDEEADAQAAEENPYADIKLESLLLPLVSAASLPQHPSLSIAYTSRMLIDMAQHAYEMVQRERKTLINAKKMLTKFRDDLTWIPCGRLVSAEDEKLFDTSHLYPDATSNKMSQCTMTNTPLGKVNGFAQKDLLSDQHAVPIRRTHREQVNGTPNASINDSAESFNGNGKRTADKDLMQSGTLTAEGSWDILRKDTDDENLIEMRESRNTRPRQQESAVKNPGRSDGSGGDAISGVVETQTSITGQEPGDCLQREREHTQGIYTDGIHTSVPGPPDSNRSMEKEAGSKAPSPNAADAKEDGEAESAQGVGVIQLPPRRMRTRAQAQAASEPTASSRTETPEAWVPPDIHPLFLIPASALPDRDCGLPSNEAEETRRLLTAYVQKQEEIIRGANMLYEGLMKAERQRKTVFKWCKAEGHVGEMSDGEDWYDKDEWGLEDDLRKGHLEEEEDTAVAGKKGRRGRA